MTARAKQPEWQSPKATALMLVSLYVPEAAGEEKDMRARVCAARERARSMASWGSSPEGARLYDLAASIAERWWRQRGIGVDELWLVLKVFSYIAIAAEALERLEAPNA